MGLLEAVTKAAILNILPDTVCHESELGTVTEAREVEHRSL
jgi:hypothetical protein